MPFKIATWNVNSLRVRLSHVLAWLEAEKPDVLALQEIKLQEVDFPYTEIQAAGYTAAVSGQKTYNGVAVLSRAPCTNIITDVDDLDDHQRRILAVTIGDIRIINLYVPNGESVGSEKYQYKLNWLNKLTAHLRTELKEYPKTIILGDFNIAPADIDVHDPAMWAGSVLFSEPEKQAFQSILSVGFADCFRQLAPAEKSYSWWDYRMNAFKRNLGLRIDHILVSQPLMAICKSCSIDQNPRALERPSDHAPVVAEFI